MTDIPLTKKELSYWIGIIVLLVAFAASYGQLSQQVSDLCDRMVTQNLKIERLEQQLVDVNRDNTQVQIALARIEADLVYIRTWIERQTQENNR
jgi:hypothetical protein